MRDESAAVRLELEGPIFTSIENWRRSQSKIPSRSEAVRQLVERGLKGSSAASEAQAKSPEHASAAFPQGALDASTSSHQ